MAKLKYNKRRGKKWLPWKRKSPKSSGDHNHGSRPQLATLNVNKIGVSDGSFLDSASQAYYQWESINPLYEPQDRKAPFKRGGVPSLRHLCSKLIAENASDLNTLILSSISAPCLKLIWHNVLACNNDSFNVFNSFAALMFQLPNFRCHLPPMESRNLKIDIRQNYLRDCLIPKGLNHRIENIFSNIRIQHLIFYLNCLKYDNEVMLDFSLVPDLTREDLLLLFKIKSLTGLNLSNSSVIDDSILYYLTVSLRDNKLPKLKVLNLVNCPKLTKDSIEKLLIASTHSSLSIIICDKLWQPKFHEVLPTTTATGIQIEGTNWISYNDLWAHKKYITKFSLSLAYYYIDKELGGLLPQKFPTHLIILDIMFHDHKYEPFLSDHFLDKVLANRINSRCQLPLNCTVLAIDRSRELKPIITQPIKQEKSPTGVFSSVKVVRKKPVQKRSTIKRKKINVHDMI